MWCVWTITAQKYKKVIEYLDTLSLIDEYFYPLIEKEYKIKNKLSNREIPLYSNYIFIKYTPSKLIDLSLLKCVWIHNCIGNCSQIEIDRVRKLSMCKYNEIVPTSSVQKGCSYKLKNTPFKGMICTVVDINKNSLTVSITLFGSDRIIKCGIDDVSLKG